MPRKSSPLHSLENVSRLGLVCAAYVMALHQLLERTTLPATMLAEQ